MFNGQNFANGFAQGQQQSNSNGVGGGAGGAAQNPQLQALLQQQQMQQLRWQQMQTGQSQQSVTAGDNAGPLGGSGMSSAAPQPFFNPAAFLNQAAGGNAILSQPGGGGGGSSGSGTFSPAPVLSGNGQGMSFHQQGLMPGMGALNSQQLQAIMGMAAPGGSGTGIGGADGMFNPSMMMNNQPQQQQQQQQQMVMMMAALQQQQQASSSSSSSMIDPSMLQNVMSMGAGGGAGRGTNQFPPGPYGMLGGHMNGTIHQPRPSNTAAIASQDAGRSTPDPFKNMAGKGGPGPSKAVHPGNVTHKARTPSIKMESTSTPSMAAASITGVHPGQFVASPLAVGPQAANLDAMELQQQQQRQHHRSPSLDVQQRPRPPPTAAIASWRPSLSSEQQLEVMTKVWKYSQANSIDPVDVLRRMKLVYVRGDELPGGGHGRLISPKSENPRSGMALITFDEARLLGDYVHAVRPGQEATAIGPFWLDQQQQTDRSSQPQPSQGGGPGSSFHPPSPAFGSQQLGQDVVSMLQQQEGSQQRPSSRSDSRSDTRPGFPATAGIMGPPLNSVIQGPSAAPDEIGRQSVVPGSADPRQRSLAPMDNSAATVGGTEQLSSHAGRPSTQQLPPGQGGMGMPMSISGGMPVQLPGSLPSGMSMPMASTVGPSLMPHMGSGGLLGGPPGYTQSPSRQVPQAPSQQGQLPPRPELPPVLGGSLPPTNAQGYSVTSLNTQVTPLPNFRRPSLTREDLHGAFWQPFTQKDEDQLLSIMKRDIAYTDSVKLAATQRSLALRQRVEEIQPHSRRTPDGSVVAPEHLHWWERADDEGPLQPGREGVFKIVFPDERRMDLQAQRGGRKFTTSAYLERLKRRQLSAIGDKWEDLVPIRLEIDHEGWKLRDTFTWNASDDLTSHDYFSKNLCEDYGLPESSFVPLVREAIQTQIGEYLSAKVLRPQSMVITAGEKGARVKGGSRGLLSKEDMQWWSSWRDVVEELQVTALTGESEENRHKDSLSEAKDAGLNNVEKRSSNLKANHLDRAIATINPDLRINVKLDITVGAMNLLDQFDWDILDETSSPEDFAAAFASDLGLAGEFRTAIAHSIREQVDVHLRSLSLAGHSFDGSDVMDDELKCAFLPGVQRYSVTRVGQEVEDHTPKLLQLTEAEVDRQERDRDRDSKRKKRQTRGRRGVNIPDREPLKTQRTPAITGLQAAQIDAAGGAAAVAAAAGSSSILGGSGAEGVLGVRTSTRRAAAAATANMQAMSEFDTPTPAPEVRPTVLLSGVPAKRQRLEDYSVYFKYPGGLGRDDPGEPRYAPASGDRRHVGSVPFTSGALELSRPDGLSMDPSGRSRQISPSKDAAVKASIAIGANSSSSTTTPKFRQDDSANQHPNIFNGQWHCSNCGCPGWLLTTRRKGPRGEKTLCGPCGKFYHRFRRMKQADYTRDEAYHRAALGIVGGFTGAPTSTEEAAPAQPQEEPREAQDTSKISGAGGNGGREDEDEEEEEERNEDLKSKALTDTLIQETRPGSLSSTRLGSPDLPFQPVGSPDDSNSDSSQSPRSPRFSRRASPRKAGPIGGGVGVGVGVKPLLPDDIADARDQKINGGNSFPSSSMSTSRSPEKRNHPLSSLAGEGASSTSMDPSLAPLSQARQDASHSLNSAATHALGSADFPSSTTAPTPPAWLTSALEATCAQYKSDRIDLRAKAGAGGAGTTEWRIKCLDCPGKLYTPGPGESLTNFEVHLKNRIHRAAVSARIEREKGKE